METTGKLINVVLIGDLIMPETWNVASVILGRKIDQASTIRKSSKVRLMVLPLLFVSNDHEWFRLLQGGLPSTIMDPRGVKQLANHGITLQPDPKRKPDLYVLTASVRLALHCSRYVSDWYDPLGWCTRRPLYSTSGNILEAIVGIRGALYAEHKTLTIWTSAFDPRMTDHLEHYLSFVRGGDHDVYVEGDLANDEKEIESVRKLFSSIVHKAR